MGNLKQLKGLNAKPNNGREKTRNGSKTQWGIKYKIALASVVQMVGASS